MHKQLPALMRFTVAAAAVFVLGYVDLLTGYELNFFVFYFVPVAVGAWFIGLGASVCLSVLSAFLWSVADHLSGHTYSSPFYAFWNSTIRLSSFLAIGWAMYRIREMLLLEQKTTEALKQALSTVKVLESFIPICAECKKIRNQEGSWQRLEAYLMEHSNTQLSHSYCPDCAGKILKDAGLKD